VRGTGAIVDGAVRRSLAIAIAITVVGCSSGPDADAPDAAPDLAHDAGPPPPDAEISPPDADVPDAGPTCTASPTPVDEPSGPCTHVETRFMQTPSPTVETTTWWYAADGVELREEFDFAETMTLYSSYDDARRLVHKRRGNWWPGTESWSYEYDTAGRRSLTHHFSFGEPYADIAYTYDDDGRLVREVVASPGLIEPGWHVFEYSYDDDGHLVLVTHDGDPVDGVVDDSRWDEYEGNQLVRRTYFLTGTPPSGTVEERRAYIYDRAGTLARVEIDKWIPDGVADHDDRYTFDDQGRLLAIDHWNLHTGQQYARDEYTYGTTCMSTCLEQ
jgi:hypothetical protein